MGLLSGSRWKNKWMWSVTHLTSCTRVRISHLKWRDSTSQLSCHPYWYFHFWLCFAGYSCDHFWETNQKLQACYQFNLYTILTWSQAQSTCQAQGGNLLSITSLAEQSYIRGRQQVREPNFPSSIVVLHNIWCVFPWINTLKSGITRQARFLFFILW